MVDDGICPMATAKDIGVVTRATAQAVRAFAANQAVVTLTGSDGIISGVTAHEIVAARPGNSVIASIAEDDLTTSFINKGNGELVRNVEIPAFDCNHICNRNT